MPWSRSLIIKKGTVRSCSISKFTLGAGFFGFIHHVPIWFQAVQEVGAIGSGIRSLPMLVGTIIGTAFAGQTVVALDPATTTAEWIRYQA
ncbi:hypothetical protein DL764_004301 [Monosporascus ibericus]|uniref:Major facilitator superfamily (MFS) profile domain-containing protein n=1 Tax=Monosporascus ibericus TaxID=155417 RepID=A0A4Q4TD99_9PEZI|nr:hypothetical protein DL764_004301 [Monosporascus ibericus]